MNDFTIANEYTLPSEGKVYGKDINPTFKLRSMTTMEEMKRLNHSDKPNKNLSEIIDECIVGNKLGISAYDLCLPDFQFVLHKLRIVTYGPSYKLSSNCPWCGSQNSNIVNLGDLGVVEFNEDTYHKYSEFELPVTKHEVKLNPQTPRMLDSINSKIKERRKKSADFFLDPTLLVTLEHIIDTVDGRVLERFMLPEFIKKLPMMDTNHILKSAEKMNELFGLDKSLEHTCSVCGLDYTGNFRTTPEFFGPSID